MVTSPAPRGMNYFVQPESDCGSDPFAGTTGYLFERRTYEEMVAFWPHQPDSNPMAASLNATQKHVVSSTIKDAS